MKLKVFSTDGTTSEEKEFANFPAFEGDKGIAAVRQVVIAHQANKRQGNASTKTRAEVAGSGKKLFRQKGSGTARQGSRRVPHQRHGGVAHGPKPRDYSQKINRKMKALAFQRALFNRATEGGLSVIEAFEVKEPKTKLFNKVLTAVLPTRGKVLIIDDALSCTHIVCICHQWVNYPAQERRNHYHAAHRSHHARRLATQGARLCGDFAARRARYIWWMGLWTSPARLAERATSGAPLRMGWFFLRSTLGRHGSDDAGE